MRCQVENIDCREGIKSLEDNSIDSIITDPPYEISMLGKSWDNSGIAFDVNLWKSLYAKLKPGGHVLAFGASRTYHRLAVSIEDAGFEIKDCIMWIYNTGMPHGKNLKDEFSGWSTALKPAYEPIVVAKKPSKDNAQVCMAKNKTGALNIQDCRVNNRWPSNVITDDDSTFSYFYCPKASAKDRDEGLDDFPLQRTGSLSATVDGSMLTGSGNPRKTQRRNIHPTVKPTELMRYLCKLTTHKEGIILDPFAGSGSTGKAAKLEGFNFIGFELDAYYAKIANARISSV